MILEYIDKQKFLSQKKYKVKKTGHTLDMELKFVNFNDTGISDDQTISPEKTWFNPHWLTKNPEHLLRLSAERQFLYQTNHLQIEGKINPNRVHSFGGDFILTLPFGQSTVVFHCDIQGHGFSSALRGQLIMQKFIELTQDKNNYGKGPEWLLMELGHKLDEAVRSGTIDHIKDDCWNSQLFEACIMTIKQEDRNLIIHSAGNSAGHLTVHKKITDKKESYIAEESPRIVTLIDLEGFKPLSIKKGEEDKKKPLLLSPGEEIILFSDGWEHLEDEIIIDALRDPKKLDTLLAKENTHDDLSFLRITNNPSAQKIFSIKDGRKPDEKKERDLIENRLAEHKDFSAYLNRALQKHLENNVDAKTYPSSNGFLNSYLKINWGKIGEEFLKHSKLTEYLRAKVYNSLPEESITDETLVAIFNYLLAGYGIYYLNKHISAVDSYFLEIINTEQIEAAYREVSRKEAKNGSSNN